MKCVSMKPPPWEEDDITDEMLCGWSRRRLALLPRPRFALLPKRTSIIKIFLPFFSRVPDHTIRNNFWSTAGTSHLSLPFSSPIFIKSDMARSARSGCRISSRQFRSSPYQEDHNLKSESVLESKDYEEATCSVCMEFPHNAVLLLCSSHDKGCRPYMCGTSYRHSNCLDKFKNAYKKVGFVQPDSVEENPSSLDRVSPVRPLSGQSEVLELPCPLCRGQVKGCTVLEPARRYLNNKKRGCMQNDCYFVGTYKELKKHLNKHPCAKPREINPEMEEKWRMLELESERQDVISSIRSSMPGSVVLGDYVINITNSGADSEVEAGEGTRRGISRSILHYLRESAQFMSLQMDNGISINADANIFATFAAVFYPGDDSHAVPATNRRRVMDLLRAGRRSRRRQGRSRRS